MARALRVATRGSALARRQAELVAERLGGPTELVIVSTRGDRDQASSLHVLGGVGVFVKEVQDAVLRGDADIAVHSAKDLPALTPAGLVLAAVPERIDRRDVLVGATLDGVPTGGRVGTGSVRRRAQLASVRPDLTFGELRGNIATRLEKASEFHAVVVAAAALGRLGLAARVAEVLDPAVVLPQVGQGALAVECRADDAPTRAALAAIDDPAAHAEVRVERAFLAELGGGCNLPCAGSAMGTREGALTMQGLLASHDGRIVLRAGATGSDPEVLGSHVARRILDDHGGALLLEGAA